MPKVLVTGGSGFVAGHVIVRLLAEGHQVRATLRNASREPDVREMVTVGGQQLDNNLQFCIADLMDDAGWEQACAGCDYVLHLASPFPQGAPKDENELIRPARDGTLRVLRAARDAGVRRVVLTSSFAAVGYGHNRSDLQHTFTEGDWTDVTGQDVAPYIKSKTLAEQAAWHFIEEQGGGLELTVLNPTGIFGPILGVDYSSSIALVAQLLKGMLAVPRIAFGVVDVRDLAELYLAAMTADAAGGERFIAVGEPTVSLHQAALMIRENLGREAEKVPAREFPDWAMHLMAPFSKSAKATLPQLGKVRRASNTKARVMLNWHPRPVTQTIVETARSLIDFGLV